MTGSLTERNRKFVTEIYAAYVRGDVSVLMGALADDVCWTSGEDPAPAPWCGSHDGRAGVERYFAELLGRCEILRYDVGEVIADGDSVAATATVRVRYRHSGAERELAKVDIIRLREGKVVAFREYYDTATMLTDLR